MKFRLLYDARFIAAIDLLKSRPLIAIYIVRLLTGFGLRSAKKYVNSTERFLSKSKNKIQYIQ